MKHQRLRRIVAVAILDTLFKSPLSFAGVKRYVTSDLLCSYGIRRSTRVTDQDYAAALEIARTAVRCKPVSFRYAPRGSPKALERSKDILEIPG